ncbi:unnamed protein product [Didymodactylos carnosus]|uniref:MATH domain-containing protein n=1 Tax=Didymodactylos carnosus TaxID=1234261 RepID=A0A815VTY6_9BILA|nr:unnamed protein product [Didymodactylos carnosus]CAF1536550.1 unnamed protein product [Didymodactylos carnosus]CAF3529561.1 unnamed protein product [Didymodactylos carnosus]CAF4396492.1 unnamed protein product [Didymodactylos carnosus]
MCHVQIMLFQFIRSERGNHLESEQHQKSVLVMLEKLQQLLSTVNNSTEPLITAMNSSVSSFKTIREEHIEQNLSMDFESGDTAPSSSRINDLRDEFQKYDDILITLTQGVQTLFNDINRLSTKSLSLTSLIQAKYEESNQLKKIRLESDNRIAANGPIQESLEQELSNVKENIESIEFTTHDGMKTWKVDNISEKMAAAQSERQNSIYSQPFYSPPAGYKMRARLYLNGDENARRTHMPLFFVLMKGEYDSILKWPFNHKVTFCLLDQSGQNQHEIDSFRPDIKSTSF